MELVKKYVIKYSVYFHYYSFGGDKKTEVRFNECEIESPSLEEASRRFKDYFYTKKESYFVTLPGFGWRLTYLEIDKIWEPPANLEKILNRIWTYYDDLLKRVGEGPCGGMNINQS